MKSEGQPVYIIEYFRDKNSCRPDDYRVFWAWDHTETEKNKIVQLMSEPSYEFEKVQMIDNRLHKLEWTFIKSYHQ